MKFDGIRWMNVDLLGLSQIYLNADKIAAVLKWFDPKRMDNFQPLPVRNFENGVYTLTDGHTRAYVAYQNGVSYLPVIYDDDEIVAGEIGQRLYKADMEWCKRFRLFHIKQLGSRIINNDEYQKLWIGRCDRSYHLLTRFSDEERMLLQERAPELFLYGASEDMSTLFFENEAGELFLLKDHVLRREDMLGLGA